MKLFYGSASDNKLIYIYFSWLWPSQRMSLWINTLYAPNITEDDLTLFTPEIQQLHQEEQWEWL